MGDALAIVLMKRRGFKDENFARFHPGGSLGKKLLLKVENVMKIENLPIVNLDANIKDIVHVITTCKSGLVVVLDKKDIKGVITDGDIRRAMETNEKNFFKLQADELMTRDPKTINKNEKLIDANEIMNETKINTLLVVNDDDNLIGLVQLFDLGL